METFRWALTIAAIAAAPRGKQTVAAAGQRDAQRSIRFVLRSQFRYTDPLVEPAKNFGASTPAPPRRSKLRALLFLLLAAGVLLAIDSFFIEPNWIEVTHLEIHATVSSPLRIAQLSDLHTRGLGRRERRMLKFLDAEKPDLIVITGDNLPARTNDYRSSLEVISRLHAPLGVWVVRGNWENWRPAKHERAVYAAAGARILLNESASVRPDVWLVGLDDPWSGVPKLDAALAGVPPEAFKILLFHSPFFFERAAGRADLCLAGHTHGGQVRFPFLPPLWLPGGCGRYVEGWYEERGSKMYVSRGLGTSVLPVRFLCRPELVILTVLP